MPSGTPPGGSPPAGREPADSGEEAVIDRIVAGMAVLLVGEAEREVHCPAGELPAGAREGDWLRVEFDGQRLVRATLDPEATERARARIREKLERLRRRGRPGKP